jgi:hypothetical protein
VSRWRSHEKSLTLVAATIAAAGCGQREPERTHEQVAQARCEDSIAAFVMSKEFVKQRLKAPASADFHWGTQGPDVSVMYVGGCTHEVRAYVDAENSFGAKLRSRYYAKELLNINCLILNKIDHATSAIHEM